jgi:hypothetical protein
LGSGIVDLRDRIPVRELPLCENMEDPHVGEYDQRTLQKIHDPSGHELFEKGNGGTARRSEADLLPVPAGMA